jgi:hypothetical protein
MALGGPSLCGPRICGWEFGDVLIARFALIVLVAEVALSQTRLRKRQQVAPSSDAANSGTGSQPSAERGDGFDLFSGRGNVMADNPIRAGGFATSCGWTIRTQTAIWSLQVDHLGSPRVVDLGVGRCSSSDRLRLGVALVEGGQICGVSRPFGRGEIEEPGFKPIGPGRRRKA